MAEITFTLSLIILGITARLIYFGLKAKFMAYRTVPYSQKPQNSTLKIICLGDSMGVGVGAAHPNYSLLGNLGRDLPFATIVNHCISGTTIRRLFEYLKTQNLEQYDIAIVMVGGMDIIKHTRTSIVEKTLSEFIQYLKNYTERIVVIIPNHTGHMPIYPFPVNHILNRRAKRVREIFMQISALYECEALDAHVDLLAVNPGKYYAADLAHPNDLGYATWYASLRSHLLPSLLKKS